MDGTNINGLMVAGHVAWNTQIFEMADHVSDLCVYGKIILKM